MNTLFSWLFPNRSGDGDSSLGYGTFTSRPDPLAQFAVREDRVGESAIPGVAPPSSGRRVIARYVK